MSEAFRFKRFSVKNEASGLKVGTDAVVLGAVGSIAHLAGASAPRILDIGTGTGVIALMFAQRLHQSMAESAGDNLQPSILGIDIDACASAEAAENFQASPWKDCLQARNVALQQLPESEWELIVSNPPFFENSLKAPDAQRSAARHTDCLSYREIVVYASHCLAPDGLLEMILPSQDETPLQRYAASFGLYLQRLVEIRTTEKKAAKRIVAELGRKRVPTVRESLVLMSDGNRSARFNELTADFYL